jgi:ABC-type glycerol-3-phosphate transport system substrate-binding protein
MKTKLSLLFSLLLISAFVLAACGGGATEAPSGGTRCSSDR